MSRSLEMLLNLIKIHQFSLENSESIRSQRESIDGGGVKGCSSYLTEG